ncbi:unnamed protein product [Sphagnum troendelagicum]|uniref:TIR domain-containing protein n=1 Tax=Sphagnum troendelagicum TaxID=128251 RepID=A0ABP0ULM7_9BRYO
MDAPSVAPEVQVSPVPEDVRPLPPTVSYDIQSLGKYDVFLNHRGPDVKDAFVAHLNDALCAAGFHPFLDAKSLIKGKHPYNSINEALSGVGVHVAIFSKGYAESKYCLDELHDMLESGKLILPVFYGVEVEHLRRPYDGPFAAGLRKHKKRGRHQDVERWETALAKVADLQGFRLAEFNGDEAQLKRRIVLAVQRALPARRLQQVAPHRVGLEESLKVVIKKLNLTGDSVGIIGVFGMGGIGKTTLVREVYNHFAMEKRFEEQSFLKDVRSITDPLDLQKQLVYDLLQEDLQSSEKFSYWFDRFMGRKALIVVDDIDHRSQFDVLIPHIDKLARGSRILVTSRDQNVLTNIMRGDGHLTAMHEVELMSPHDSYRLFNWHAFYNEKASDGFQDLARKVADACCRLPLALEVIGAFLFDKKRPEDRDCWHQATETLRANGDILNKLKISYDGLSSDESRLMFTDIACFLIGKDEQMAMQIFESCISYTGPQVSFHALMDKSLVTLDSDRRIRMHDLLRDMGRNVVTKQSQIEGQRSHLWDPAMAERVLRKNQGTDTVRGLSVAGAKDGAAWKAETYTRMSELHFLILDHCQVKGDFSTWSKELRWLQWWSLPLSELPPTLSLLNLSVLDLTGSKSVTRISPKNSNDEFPCKELRMLILKDCTALEELPQTIGKLSRLKNLDVQGCSTLKALPDSFPCKELRMLILKDCTALEELPQTIGKLSRLKNLDVQGCSTLKALPDSVGELVELTQLNLSNCTTLKRLPDTICLLSKLQKLWLINCTKLKFLPIEFGKLQRLDEFWADATSLSRLPYSFSQLSNLEDLHLHKCENIQELPSMSGLFPCKELRMLILKDCTALEELPQTIGKLSRLKNLDVQGCSTLKALPDSVGELVELTQLNLSNCTTLKRLPDTICLLSKLQKLWLINCTKLKFLPIEFGKLQRLDEFWADATSLSKLPHSFSQLSNLEDLHLHKCENIQELPSMSGLAKLKLFHMGHIGVQTLPEDFGHLENLVELHLYGCRNLETLPQSFGLLQLQRLEMNDNPQLEMLPEGFGRLKSLVDLRIGNNSILSLLLSELPLNLSFPCKELRMLILKDCTALEELPQTIGKLSRLKNLDVQGCSTLRALPDSVGELVELTQLNLSNCTTLERLPDTICRLSKLKKLCPVPEDMRPLPPTASYDIQSLGKYDVFLNHRGPDVKDTFVAHLNDALCAAGFHPFLDAKSLIKGKHPYNSINKALSGVGVHVAIFSKGYAESKYCLDELHDMLESGKLILPVFYGVEVEHLRRPYDGPFAAGLRKHKKRGRHQDVERWETALAKVADLQGFRLAEFNGDEAQLKRRIVLAVQRALPARRLQQVAPHRVGLEESLKVVIKKLNLTGDSVGIIGVFGMGGIGKTTLVREVYNHFAMEKRFEEQSFLKDVRSITDPLDLQKQLVYDLLQEDLQSSEKFSYWFDRFMGRKVLIVVDDIDHRSQFDVLIPHIDKLARGSRILVTSRDQNVLTNIMRGDGHLTAMHEVELMSPHDSYRLFNWHAFYNEKASDGFQDLARKVADACCRLPLALEVIGAFLFDKKRPEDRDCWHQATETLRANGDILNKLKISYDGLSSDESRLMFTDIACFLIGKDEQMAMQIFESCISYTGPQVSFHALMDKSLVTLDSDRRIRMHDLLRDMGRNVVTKQSQIEGQRSHLWDPAMAERVLRKNQGTDTVRGLSVAGAKDGAAWKAETYTRMSELHFLILDHCQVKGDFSTWSKELRWLQWWSLPLSELPPTLSLLNLSVLDLTGSKSVTRISPKNSNDEVQTLQIGGMMH